MKSFKKITCLILINMVGCQAIEPNETQEVKDQASFTSARPLATGSSFFAPTTETTCPVHHPIPKRFYNWPMSSQSPMPSSSSSATSSAQSLFQSDPEMAVPFPKRAKTSPEAQQTAALLLASSSTSLPSATTISDFDEDTLVCQDPNLKSQSPYRIDQLLQERDWSERELANLSGVSLNQIYILKKGKSTAKRETLEKIAMAFGVQVQELFVDPNQAQQKVFSCERLQQLMKDKNVSFNKLVELTGIHRTYISDLRTGRYNASPETAQKIAQALEVDVQEFYTSVESPGAARAPRVSPYRIEELIQAKNWSGSELARRSELSRSFINRLIHRETTGSLKTLQAIAQALDVEVKDLFKDPAQYDTFMCSR